MGSTATLATPTAVTLEHRGRVLVVTIDNPPVNALGAEVRRGLVAAIDAAQADAAVGAVLLVGAGRYFLAGADIREFGQPAQPPSLPEVCNRIEACSKPIIAAMHGATLNGSFTRAWRNGERNRPEPGAVRSWNRPCAKLTMRCEGLRSPRPISPQCSR